MYIIADKVFKCFFSQVRTLEHIKHQAQQPDLTHLTDTVQRLMLQSRTWAHKLVLNTWALCQQKNRTRENIAGDSPLVWYRSTLTLCPHSYLVYVGPTCWPEVDKLHSAAATTPETSWQTLQQVQVEANILLIHGLVLAAAHVGWTI